GGGKTSRTHLAVVDYFPNENKVFLSHLYRDIGEEDGLSSDTVLINLIEANNENVQNLAIDAPLTTPIGLRKPDSFLQGVEHCKEKEVKWMWEQHKKLSSIKRPHKIFTPYTERCVEQWMTYNL